MQCEGIIMIIKIISTTLIVWIGQLNDPIRMIDIITKDLKVTKINLLISQSLKTIIGIKTFINTKEIGVVMCWVQNLKKEYSRETGNIRKKDTKSSKAIMTLTKCQLCNLITRFLTKMTIKKWNLTKVTQNLGPNQDIKGTNQEVDQDQENQEIQILKVKKRVFHQRIMMDIMQIRSTEDTTKNLETLLSEVTTKEITHMA